MNPLFFSYGSLEIEIARKIDSLRVSSGKVFEALLEKVLASGLDETGRKRIEELFGALRQAQPENDAKNLLNHPIRVAASWWDANENRSYETLALGLCHNIRETNGDVHAYIEREFLGQQTRNAIALLTIDRERERDLAYLKSFYGAIHNYQNRLLTLKGLDKLDNFLSYVLYDLDPYYFMVIDDFVTPRLVRENLVLANYLQSVADLVRTDHAKQKYSSFKSAIL